MIEVDGLTRTVVVRRDKLRRERHVVEAVK